MDENYVQAKFISPSASIILPDYQFSLPTTSSSPDDLNELVNKLITDSDSEWKSCSFDFIVDGILLRVPLNEFMTEHNFSNEDVLTIECILKEEAPVPHCTFTHEDWVADLTLTSKFLISASYDSTVHVWSLKNKKRLSKITGHSGAVKCIALLPKTDDSTLNFVTGSQDQSIMMWSFDEKTNKTICKVVGRGHMRSVECLCSNEDGSKLASGSFDSYIKIWNTDPESSNEDCENIENANKKLKVNNEEQTAVTKAQKLNEETWRLKLLVFHVSFVKYLD
uniref:NLE domain-containing protein n=1 Tax=Romanomermis culicivorax TaxID=13658 RepID=A0A915HYT4_ROMCU